MPPNKNPTSGSPIPTSSLTPNGDGVYMVASNEVDNRVSDFDIILDVRSEREYLSGEIVHTCLLLRWWSPSCVP